MRHRLNRVLWKITIPRWFGIKQARHFVNGKWNSCSIRTHYCPDVACWGPFLVCSFLLLSIHQCIWHKLSASQFLLRNNVSKIRWASLCTWANSSSRFLILSSRFFLLESCPRIFLMASAWRNKTKTIPVVSLQIL